MINDLLMRIYMVVVVLCSVVCSIIEEVVEAREKQAIEVSH